MRKLLTLCVLAVFASSCATHFDERPFDPDLPTDNGWVAALVTMSDKESIWFTPVGEETGVPEARIGGNQITRVSNTGAFSWSPTTGVGGAMTSQSFRREEVMLISVPSGRYRLGSLIAGAQGAGQFTTIAKYSDAKVEFEVLPGTVTLLGAWSVTGTSHHRVSLSWSDAGEVEVLDYLAARGHSPELVPAFSEDPLDGFTPEVTNRRNLPPQFIFIPG